MGSYGIGMERILAAAAELYGDEDGLAMPVPIAPFEVLVTPIKVTDPSLRKAADEIYAGLKAKGIDVLYDDRDESPGVRFKDADLIGVPYRINIGRKLAQGKVEVIERKTKKITELPVVDAAQEVAALVKAART